MRVLIVAFLGAAVGSVAVVSSFQTTQARLIESLPVGQSFAQTATNFIGAVATTTNEYIIVQFDDAYVRFNLSPETIIRQGSERRIGDMAMRAQEKDTLPAEALHGMFVFVVYSEKESGLFADNILVIAP